MTEADKPAFFDLLGSVYDFYRQDLSEATGGIWWGAMLQFDLEAVRKALGQHCMNPDNGQFCPKPADVVRMLGGSTVDSALVAWTKFEGAVQRLGAYYTVAFDDPLVHRVVEDMGGWVVLCHTTLKDWPFRQNEFVNRYRGYKMRGEVPAYAARLVGVFDGENGAKGYEVDDTNLRLVGDPGKAALVVAGGSAAPRLGISRVGQLAGSQVKALVDKAVEK